MKDFHENAVSTRGKLQLEHADQNFILPPNSQVLSLKCNLEWRVAINQRWRCKNDSAGKTSFQEKRSFFEKSVVLKNVNKLSTYLPSMEIVRFEKGYFPAASSSKNFFKFWQYPF